MRGDVTRDGCGGHARGDELVVPPRALAGPPLPTGGREHPPGALALTTAPGHAKGEYTSHSLVTRSLYSSPYSIVVNCIVGDFIVLAIRYVRFNCVLLLAPLLIIQCC